MQLNDPISEVNILAMAFKETDVVNEIAHELSVTDFADKRHQLIFEAVLKLYKLDQAVTYQTVADMIGSDLPKAGSLNYLLELNSLGAGYELQFLIRELKKSSKAREIASFGAELINLSKQSEDFGEFISRCSSRSNHIFNYVDDNTFLNLQEYLAEETVYKDAVERQKKAADGIEIFRGYPTGYKDLDQKILGLRPGHLAVIGARPGVGKTTFMLNLADKMKDRKVGIFSLEMTGEELATKLVLLKSKVNYDMFSSGKLNPEDIQAIHGFSKELQKRTILIDDAGGVRPFEILGRARRWKIAHGLDILFVDYLQLMNGNERRYENNQVKVASISRELKRIAKALEVPIVALAQVNRNPEGRDKNVPKISDLRESGAIEADADHIWLLHRSNDLPYNLEVHIGKNRFGPTGKVELFWDLEKGNIESKAFEENPAYAEYSPT